MRFDSVLIVRVTIPAMVALAIVLRLTGWVFPYDVRLWGMYIAGTGFGWTLARVGEAKRANKPISPTRKIVKYP